MELRLLFKKRTTLRPSLLPNLTPGLVLLSQSKVFTTVKNESLGDITLSDIKDAAVNNFKIINLIHQSGSESVLYKIITLVLDEAEPIRADGN